jgi:hypothetical protein
MTVVAVSRSHNGFLDAFQFQSPGDEPRSGCVEVVSVALEA